MFWTVTQSLLGGLWTTFEIFILTLIFALPLGLILAFGSMSKFKPLRYLVQLLVWVIRGTPLMLQLIVVYFGPYYLFGTNLKGYRFPAIIIAFAVNYAAYFAEIYRGGIESMPVGQYEAAQILGYNKAQTFFKIILPQMVKRVIPAVTNEVITLVKDTSLASVIGTVEMFTRAKQIVASPNTPGMLALVAAGVFYYVFNYVVAFAMEKWEQALRYYR